jgi:hypothetical protein
MRRAAITFSILFTLGISSGFAQDAPKPDASKVIGEINQALERAGMGDYKVKNLTLTRTPTSITQDAISFNCKGDCTFKRCHFTC